MNLGTLEKKQLLFNADKIYRFYVGLDFIRNKRLCGDGQSARHSLYEVCEQAINAQQLQQNITINDHQYSFCLTPMTQSRFALTITVISNYRPLPIVTKALNDYSDQEACDLLCHQNFLIDRLDNGECTVSIRHDEHHVIGGRHKIQLYRSHLVTLYAIIEKIRSETTVSSLLVALATGSGKTYIQALWMYIIYSSGFMGIFTVPDKLVVQFRNDLARLLPDLCLQRLKILRSNTTFDAETKELFSLGNTGKIIIASSECILGEHYQTILYSPPSKTFLSFDEQHLIMQSERSRVRWMRLNQTFLSLSLTATPNRETYELSGSKPVALMSSKQKQQAGQGIFPLLLSNYSKYISDVNREQRHKLGSSAHKMQLVDGFLLKFNDSLQKEHSSAALSIIRDLPFYVHKKPGESDLRWQLQVAITRKMLVIIDDNQSLVNFCHSLQTGESNIYHNGNFIRRNGMANFFQIPDPDITVLDEAQARQHKEYCRELSQEEQNILTPIINCKMNQQLRANIFHYMVEYVLSELTSFSSIELDNFRKLNLDVLQHNVTVGYKPKTVHEYNAQLAKLIDQKGSEQISILLCDIHHYLGYLLEQDLKEDLACFIDNWFLSHQLFRNLCSFNPLFEHKFKSYSDQHLVMGVMSGMASCETAIKDSVPFLGLREDKYRLYGPDGIVIKEAKKRQRTALELLIETTVESRFEPKYLEVSEDIADHYFRLGFVGAYVSNKKTEGFSDANLHTVINIAEETFSSNNSPELLIQGIGRLRGLNETIVPTYIHALGRKQQSVFDLNLLNTDDYYPELFAAQAYFNQGYISVLGEQVGHDIITWYYANRDKDEGVDPDILKRQVLKYVAAALRELNAKNNHKITLSRAQFSKVVSHAMHILNKEIDAVKSPYNISILLRMFGAFIDFLCECYYAILRLKAWFQLYQYANLSSKTQSPHSAADTLYLKIINHTNFKQLIAQTVVAGEFRTWGARKADVIQATIIKTPYQYFQPEVAVEFEHYVVSLIIPLIKKMVIDSKVVTVHHALSDVSSFINLLQRNQSLIQLLFDEDSKELIIPNILELLHQIPGLESLSTEDMVNYPQRIQDSLIWAKQPHRQMIATTPELKNRVSEALGHYLNIEFLQHLSAFVTYPDQTRINDALRDESRCKEFITHLIEMPLDHEFGFESILEDAKLFFQLQEVDTLNRKASSLMVSLQHLQSSIVNEQIDKMAIIIHAECLPCLVNFYPLDRRKAILMQSTLDKVKNWLRSDPHIFDNLAAMDAPNELAAHVFSKLGIGALPPQIDIQDEIGAAKACVMEELAGKNTAQPPKFRVISGIFNAVVGAVTYMTGADHRKVVALLKNEAVLHAMSLMLPYTQWQQLERRIDDDPESVDRLATLLIEKISHTSEDPLEDYDFEANLNSALREKSFVNDINIAFNTNFKDSKTSLEEAKCKLIACSKLSSAQLSTTQKTELVHVIENEFLPILAAFIKDDTKKHSFLACKHDPNLLCDFMMTHRELLMRLGDAQPSEQLFLINILSVQPLEESDIVSITSHGATHMGKCKNEASVAVIATCIMSDGWKHRLADFYNDEDYQLLASFLEDSHLVTQAAQTIVERNIEVSDIAGVLAVFKAIDHRLVPIASLHERQKQFKQFMSRIKEDPTVYESNKIIDLALEQLSPILCHPQFQASMNVFVGQLTEHDLTLIYQAKNHASPEYAAARLSLFVTLIQKKDMIGLKREFMTLALGEEFSFDALPLKQIWDELFNVAQEVIDCHCYFHQHNRKGDSRYDALPSLLHGMSEDLKQIRIEKDDSLMSYGARKVFFIKGISIGLQYASQISADSNAHSVTVLNRVVQHLIRPLWWSINLSQLGYRLLWIIRNLVFALKAVGYALWNGLRGIAYVLTGAFASYKASTKNEISLDYNNSAFEYADIVNSLTPLTEAQVLDKDCPQDIIKNLEVALDKKPALHRSRFFYNNTKPIETTAVEKTSVRSSVL